jgi:hypothetical protein
VWAGFKTPAYAKDRASLSRDGLLKENPTPCSSELLGVNDQPVAARERYSGFISTSLLLLIFCSYKIQIVNEDENQLPVMLFLLYSFDMQEYNWHSITSYVVNHY